MTVLGLLAGKQRLEVCLPIKVGRHHEALAVGVGGGEEHEVAGELVMVVHPDDVADHDLLTAQGLKLTAAEYSDLAVIDLSVTLVSAVILITLKQNILIFLGACPIKSFFILMVFCLEVVRYFVI